MWCRTILTAVAISYVICMLLWSGLEKDDLDAGTLEKLGRYNVKIDDMNNEQRRQECLLDQVTTEVQRETLRTSAINERVENDVTVGIYPKIGTLLAANFDDKTVFHNEVNINKTKGNIDELPVIAQAQKPNVRIKNARNVEVNKGIIKIEYNIVNQPNVESVMNFWTKLKRYTTTVVNTLPATVVAPVTATTHLETQKVQNFTSALQAETHNNEYVHSREMEYISRILSESLASQTVPATTLRIDTEKVFPNYMPIKYWEKSNKAPVEEKPDLNKINNDTQNDLQSAKVVYNSLLDEMKGMPFNVTYVSTQLLKRVQETQSRQIQRKELKARESKPVKRNKPMGILQRLLQMKNDLFNNGVLIPETESSSETIMLFTNKSNAQHNESEHFYQFNLFKNMNDVNKNNVKNGQAKSASIKAETWEPVPLSNEQIDKEFKAPPIRKKEIEQTQNFNTNINQIEVIPPDKKKWKLHKNSDDNKASWFQAMLPSIKDTKQNKNSETTNNKQPAARQKFATNQLFKMKNDTYKTDSEIICNITHNSKVLNGKQINKAPVFEKWEPTHDSQKIKAIQEIINNFDRDNEPFTIANESSSKTTQNFDSMNMSDLQGIPANIIKEITEKVKQMVLKDIVEDITTTTVATISSTTNATTAAPTTISTSSMTTITSEKPATSLQTEFTQANHVMQKLMEIFKELKAMKDTAKLTSQMPQNTTTARLPQLPVQPYPQAVAAFKPYLLQNPPTLSSAVDPPQNKALQYMPPVNVQPTKDYHFGAITIQTNSDEIAPLAIQISKPLKLMNQHIVLTTKRTVEKVKEERERESIKPIDEKFRIPNDNRNHREKFELQSDLPKHVRYAGKHDIRDRYSYGGGKYMDREKPWYNHEYYKKVHNMESTHPVRSRFPELHYPGRLSHLSRPRDLSNSEDLSHPSRGYNIPGFNEPVSHQNEIRHHPRWYGHSVYDRQPRYKDTKFHEKLERTENWPRSSTWKDFESPSDISNDEISARQQMPLMKVKQRTRYDDSHFRNFLKSQQKVTDMLEKILANNDIKSSGPHSVETL